MERPPLPFVARAMSILLLLSFVTPAQAKTPMETAREYFDDLKQERYESAAAMFDPDALHTFRESFSFLLELPAETGTPVVRMFFGPQSTPASVKKLQDDQFYALMLKSLMNMAGKANFDRLQIIGELSEAPDLAHVVSRNSVTVQGITVEKMEVLSMKKQGEGWKLLMTGEIKGFAGKLKNSLGAGK